MPEIRSYPSIYAVGHAAARDLFDGPVVVEEKIDGSQFSFGLLPIPQEVCPEAGADPVRYELVARSKGKQLDLENPEKMFVTAVEMIRAMWPFMRLGYTYRGEYLSKAKHNALAYGRVPNNHIIIYDVDAGYEAYLTPEQKRAAAAEIGCETVPTIFEGTLTSLEQLKALLTTTSVLGNVQPEGLVVKNYAKLGPDKKTLMGKYVTEKFKEVHGKEWKAANPGKGDVVERVIAVYKTEARWEKAIQHLRENGQLDGSPRDIGPLLKEIATDVLKECETEIKDKLFQWAWPIISRGIARDFPQWYKDRLAAGAFEAKIETVPSSEDTVLVPTD